MQLKFEEGAFAHYLHALNGQPRLRVRHPESGDSPLNVLGELYLRAFLVAKDQIALVLLLFDEGLLPQDWELDQVLHHSAIFDVFLVKDCLPDQLILQLDRLLLVLALPGLLAVLLLLHAQVREGGPLGALLARLGVLLLLQLPHPVKHVPADLLEVFCAVECQVVQSATQIAFGVQCRIIAVPKVGLDLFHGLEAAREQLAELQDLLFVQHTARGEIQCSGGQQSLIAREQADFAKYFVLANVLPHDRVRCLMNERYLAFSDIVH